MPADSTELHQEGLILPPSRLDDALIDLIAANSRAGDERRGDLRAQLAVHRLAERRVRELCERRGADWWRTACAEVWDYAERRTRAAIAAMPDGRYEATETVEAAEGDLEIRAAVEIAGDAVRVDFEGTAPQHGGNLNCPLAVTVSACCFVLRVVADPDAPGLRRRLRADRGRRPGGLAGQRPRRPPRSWPATWRPRAGSPTACCARSAARRTRRRRGRGR